ncbi:MAG: NADPH-dependent FMN reductase [Candidatus Binatia bacterium]
MPTEGEIEIVTILGTTRPGNFTAKALALVVDELQQQTRVNVTEINPRGMQLLFPGEPGESKDSQLLQSAVQQATGVVLATPEYHGSFAAMMKLLIENLGFPSILAGKPVALLGVAAGQIGAIKSLEQLRSVCSHVGAIVLPGPVSIAEVQGLFDESGRCLEERIEKRIRGLATNLLDYIHDNICPRVALEQMVRSDVASLI